MLLGKNGLLIYSYYKFLLKCQNFCDFSEGLKFYLQIVKNNICVNLMQKNLVELLLKLSLPVEECDRKSIKISSGSCFTQNDNDFW
jgi:hypothetical protein